MKILNDYYLLFTEGSKWVRIEVSILLIFLCLLLICIIGLIYCDLKLIQNSFYMKKLENEKAFINAVNKQNERMMKEYKKKIIEIEYKLEKLKRGY